jgi:hypothetical protein
MQNLKSEGKIEAQSYFISSTSTTRSGKLGETSNMIGNVSSDDKNLSISSNETIAVLTAQ